MSVFTSATGGYVLPGMCLCVCLLQLHIKTTERIFMKTLSRNVSVDKEELTTIWKSSTSRSGPRIFLKDSLTLQDLDFAFQSTLWIRTGSALAEESTH